MRVANPVTPGLGGPQVTRRRDGLQGPAFASVGTKAFGSCPSPHARKGRGATRCEYERPSEPLRAIATSFFSSILWGEDRRPARTARLFGTVFKVTDSFVKGLILAQNERWRRGLGMQVERVWSSDQISGVRVSKATATNPMVGHSRGKLRVIPSDVRTGHPV